MAFGQMRRLVAVAGPEAQVVAAVVRDPDLETAGNRRAQRREKGHDDGSFAVKRAGDADALADADLDRRVAAQGPFRTEQIFHDAGHRRLPDGARQAEAGAELGVAGRPFEGFGRSVIAVVEPDFGRFGRRVAPHFDGADVFLVIAAEKDDHCLQIIAGKDRQRDAAGQPGLARGFGAQEIGVIEIMQDDRSAGRPGLAGQALIVGETHRLAGSLEVAERAVKAVEKLEMRAFLVWNPYFGHPDQGLHGCVVFLTMVSI